MSGLSVTAEPDNAAGGSPLRGLPNPSNKGAAPEPPAPATWAPLASFAVCVARYKGPDDGHLDLKFGDLVRVEQFSSNGWLYGRDIEFHRSGLFPASFVVLRDSLNDYESDPIMSEVVLVFHEWASLLRSYYASHKLEEFHMLNDGLAALLESQASIESASGNDTSVAQLKRKMLQKIEELRRRLQLDVVVRKADGKIATLENTTVMALVQLYRGESKGVIPSSATSVVSFSKQAELIRQASRRLQSDVISGALILSQPSTTGRGSFFNFDDGSAASRAGVDDEPFFQLVVDLAAFLCPIKEACEVYVAIWHRPTNKLITHEWRTDITALGMPVDQSRIGNVKALFRDLDPEQLKANHLFLLVRIVRRGGIDYDLQELKPGASPSSSSLMLPVPSLSDHHHHHHHHHAEDSGHNPTSDIRRPFGVGLLPLTSGLSTEESTSTISVWTCPETNIHNLPELILRQSEGVKRIEKAKGVVVSLTAHYLPFSVASGNPILASIRPVLRTLGYPKVIDPEDRRHEFFIILSGCEVGLAGKRTPKNIQAQLTVRRNSTGEVVPGSFRIGVGELAASEYRSTVTYHSNNPVWRERIQICIEPQLLGQTHLYATFHHVPSTTNKPQAAFGMTFLRFCDPSTNTVIPDTLHSLVVYKTKSTDDPTFYLKGVESGVKLVPRGTKGDCMFLRSELVSFVLTQNPQLHALLNWEKLSGFRGLADSGDSDGGAPSPLGRPVSVMDDIEETFDTHLDISRKLAEILRGFTYVEASEIMKFVHHIFHALVQIFELRPLALFRTVYHAAFDAFCYTINSLLTARGADYHRLIISYLDQRFSSRAMHKALLLTLTSVFMDFERDSTRLGNCMKVMAYLLQFVMRSRTVYNASRNLSVSQDLLFKKALLGFFIALNQLLNADQPRMIGAQTLAVKNFPYWFDELSKAFSVVELAGIVAKFLDSIQQVNLNKITLEKLTVIRTLAFGKLFDDNQGSRRLLFPTLLHQLITHMQIGGSEPAHFHEQLDECSEILSAVLDLAESEMRRSANLTAIFDLTHLVPSIIDAIDTLSTRAEQHLPTVQRFVGAFLTILYLLPQGAFVLWIKRQPFPSRFLLRLYTVLNAIISIPQMCFPHNWLSLCLFQYRSFFKIITEDLSSSILEELVPLTSSSSTTEIRTWILSFRFRFSFLYLPLLSLERLSVAKQRLIADKFGDMRVGTCIELLRSWHLIVAQNHHSLFAPHLLCDFLRLMLVPKDEIRQAGLEMYFTSLKTEFDQTGSFALTEKLTITSLDILANDEKGSYAFDGNFSRYFIPQLDRMFSLHSASFDVAKRTKFLTEIEELLQLIVALRTLPQTPEYEDERTIATMKLMEYLKQTDRTEAYVKYVDALVADHEQANNFIEAGCTLRMHADLISWSGPPLLTMPNYPAASSFARKEALYKRAIAFFDRGQAWEYAIQYSKELVGQYEFVQYDFEQVAEQLSLQAKFHRLCLHEQRFFSEYFRVGYYGMGLPLHVRNRAFIYRGFELERMGEFVQRIQKRYPNAALLNYTDPPPPSLLETAGQFLQIFTVKPLSKLSKAETSKMPLAIQEYHNYNNINTFLYSKPFRRRDDDPSAAAAQNEFEDLWIANYTFTSADSFPTIHRRSEIIATVKSELNPLEYAIQQVEQKSLELGKLISQYQDSKEQNISPFTMVLSGAIDAAVSGGTDNFKKAFFTSDYAAKRPDHADLLKQLKTSLHSQMSLLEVALSVHGSICPSNMADLQSHLESKLASLKNAN